MLRNNFAQHIVGIVNANRPIINKANKTKQAEAPSCDMSDLQMGIDKHPVTDELEVLNAQKQYLSQFSTSPKKNINKLLETTLNGFQADTLDIIREYAGLKPVKSVSPISPDTPISPKTELYDLLKTLKASEDVQKKYSYKFLCGCIFFYIRPLEESELKSLNEYYSQDHRYCKKSKINVPDPTADKILESDKRDERDERLRTINDRLKNSKTVKEYAQIKKRELQDKREMEAEFTGQNNNGCIIS